jgi:hypothetical protein
VSTRAPRDEIRTQAATYIMRTDRQKERGEQRRERRERRNSTWQESDNNDEMNDVCQRKRPAPAGGKGAFFYYLFLWF